MGEPGVDAISSVPCHLSGVTRVCFSPDGSTIFTGGSDCLVRIHKASEPDSEPGFHDNHTDAITSLSCSSSKLVTACIDNISRVFSFPANEFEGFITRSSGVPIRYVSLDQQGDRVAVCGDELLVKIIHVNDTSRVSLLSDNSKPIRSASWDPSGKYLVTASCDGKLRIYDTSGSAPVLLKIMEGVIGSSESDSDKSCYAVWHPSGAFFAVPTRTNDIGIIGREGWTKQPIFSQDGHKQVAGELAWSPNGKYLASAAGPQIIIWSTESRQIVMRYSNPDGAISGLQFSPSSNLLAFTSLDGSFHRWMEPIPPSLASPVTSDAAQATKIDRLLDDEFGDEEDMEEKGEELGEDFADDWIVDDDGGYGVGDDEKKWSKGRTEVVNVTKAQSSFMPGSTTMKTKKRYLAFNLIGAVDVTDLDSHYVVNVEFHDKSTRRGYHFQDHNKYTMASLGEQGIAYGAPSDGETPSTIYYRPYDSWASQSDWSVSLLPGEDALLIGAGGAASNSMGSVIVASSKGFVRFLSSSGIQRYVWRIGEEMVSLASGEEAVICVHREGGTSLDGCQNLRYSLIDLNSFELIQEGRVPLPKKTMLRWVGFTSDGTPAMYDSAGLLSVLHRFRRPGQARWVPLLDSTTLARKEGKQESYWPVGATNTHLACIILKGNENEPWFPRPLIQDIEMHMPLLNMDNQQGKLEENMVRGDVHLSLLRDLNERNPASELEQTIKEREVALDKELLQLVQSACKADSLQRALDLARLMHNAATVDAAAKVAAFYHLPGLQERIQGVKIDKEMMRVKEKRARRDAIAPASSSKVFADFVPRNGGPRRSFGGVQRDSTPAASGRSETYVPETPGEAYPTEDGGSPEGKRLRLEETPVAEPEEFTPLPRKHTEDLPISNGYSSGDRLVPTDTLIMGAGTAKNPFAKKTVPGSNPFAKQATVRPLDALKSTSFFERVDNIELSGAPKASAKAKPKPKAKTAGGKQATLFGLKKGMPPPKAITGESLDSLETEEDFEETMRDDPSSGILEESMVQETQSPEAMDLA